ncbi:MAG: prepilin-type N-terminal cleavage/methylation domain-containing protein [Nitrospira sp.]|nr:prepilin-type N-terminal cleavage/methylation domain-containing protein [Nitrospira sp.]
MTERGFTLLEVMLALAILGLALPVLLGLRNRDIELFEHARTVTTATFLAQEKLFEIEIMPFPPIGEQTGDFQNPPPGSQIQVEDKDRASRFRWARMVSATPLEVVREVRVRVSWARGETEEKVEVTSYVFLEPPQEL